MACDAMSAGSFRGECYIAEGLNLHQQAVRTSDVALRLDLYRNNMSVFLENDFQIAF